MEKKEEKKSERKYCDSNHIQQVCAYCNVCCSYICEACQIEFHFNHDMVHLESECFKKFSEYKKLGFDTQLTLKQYEKAGEAQSIDEILNAVTTKIEVKFNELIEKIKAYKDKLVSDVLEGQEMQDAINEKKYRFDENLNTLKAIQIDAQNLIESIQNDFTNKRYIVLYERNSSAEIQPLQKRLAEWKSQAVSNPLKIQQLASDLTVQFDASMSKLKSLMKVTHLSHPAPQILYDFNNENNRLFCFELATRKSSIIQLQNNIHIPYHSSMASLGNKIYFTGGDEDGYRKECFVASLKKRTITQLANLIVERRNHTLVAFHVTKRLFCVGGYNKSQTMLNSAEKYDISKNIWLALPNMIEKRQWPGACQFNDKFLYVIGGSNSETIERLDTMNEEKGWELVNIMKKPESWIGKSACAAIQVGPNEILIFGGCLKKDSDSVFIFEAETRTVIQKASMPFPSLFCQISPVIAGNLVGNIGWRNEVLYIYDIPKNTWTTIENEKYMLPEFNETP